MNDQSLIIAVAKLDGWKFSAGTFSIGVSSPEGNTCTGSINAIEVCMELCQSKHRHEFLTSRDAIIPVIEKVLINNKVQWFKFFLNLGNESRERFPTQADPLINYQVVLLATPKQLSIALVKATGKWEE